MQDRSPPTRQIFLLRTAGPYIGSEADIPTSALRRALNDVHGDPPRQWPLYLNLPLNFVPNLAFDLLDQLWRGFDAVCFSRVLCRLLQQFALTFGAGLVVAARHEVTAAKYFCHDDSSSGLFRICGNRPRRRQGWPQAVVRPAHPPNLVATIQVYGGGRASVYRTREKHTASKPRQS